MLRKTSLHTQPTRRYSRLFKVKRIKNNETIMKLNILIISLAFILFGCKKFDKLTQFYVTFDETAVVPATAGVNFPFNILTPDVETNSESTFEVNDTRKDLIEEIILTTLDLTISSPSDADFSFLEFLSVYIKADGLDEVKIAWKETIPQTTKVLKLDLTGADLKEYIKSDKFTLRLNTKTDETINSDHHIKIHSAFYVDAKVLGQ